MFKVYDDSNFVINYQDNLEKLVTNFVCYYKNNINELLKKFYLGSIDKMEIRLFSDKDLLSDIPYKLGDFAGFFNNNGVNCYININGKKSEDDIIKAIMNEIVHHIYRFYIESDTTNRIIWFDEGLAMNFSLQNDKYNDDDNFKEFLVNKIFSINSLIDIYEKFLNEKSRKYETKQKEINQLFKKSYGFKPSKFEIINLVENKKEVRYYIVNLNDIYKYKNELAEALNRYLEKVEV